MNDIVVPVVAAIAFGLPSVFCFVMIARRWRDRPATWTMGWLCVAALGATYAGGAVAGLVDSGLSIGVGDAGFGVTGSLGVAWLFARCWLWRSGRRMRRLAIAEGHPIPRGRLTAPVLVLFYLAAALASVVVDAYLWAYGVVWMSQEFTVGGIPLTVALVPAALLCCCCVLHLFMREAAPLVRDLHEFWVGAGHR